jgi:hypothetical protein
MFDSSVATRYAVPFVVDFNSSMVDFVSLASIVVRSIEKLFSRLDIFVVIVSKLGSSISGATEFCQDSQVLMK